MTTLAQRLAETPAEYPFMRGNIIDVETFARNEVQKELVWKMVHGMLGVGEQKYIDLHCVAERFVFTNNIYNLVDATRPQLPNDNIIYEFSQLPCNPIWLEWNDVDNCREGALVFQVEKYAHIIPVISLTELGEKLATPVALVRTKPFPLGTSKVTAEFLWTIKDRHGAMPPKSILDYDTARYLGIISFVLFLLTVPRVSEPVDVVWNKRIQKKRVKSGKLPLLEFKQVKLHLTQPQKRYVYTGNETPEEREAIRRRLHQVIGHFRTYQKGRDKPHITWIPPHWRGDPELGMVLHERKVER